MARPPTTSLPHPHPPSLLSQESKVWFVSRAGDREFIRVGYYVNSEYDSPELNENPPEQPIYERIIRNILADKPRVTRYQIDWA